MSLETQYSVIWHYTYCQQYTLVAVVGSRYLHPKLARLAHMWPICRNICKSIVAELSVTGQLTSAGTCVLFCRLENSIADMCDGIATLGDLLSRFTTN